MGANGFLRDHLSFACILERVWLPQQTTRVLINARSPVLRIPSNCKLPLLTEGRTRVVWPRAWLVTQQPPALPARVFVTTLILQPFLKPQISTYHHIPQGTNRCFRLGRSRPDICSTIPQTTSYDEGANSQSPLLVSVQNRN